MRGLVEASFLMRNLGDEQESFDVWFPLAASTRYPGLLLYTPENIVSDFRVRVGEKPLEWEQVMAPDLSDPQQQSAWARFPMVFPAGEDVIVRVRYTIYPSGRRPFGGFEYILQTGAGWNGPIGTADITVHLPDTVTPENVSQSGKSIEGLPLAPHPPGYIIEDNTIRWRFTDLEPTAEDNIFVDVLEPARYRALQRAREQVRTNASSADAQLELAEAAQGAVMLVKSIGQHGGGHELAEEANSAYRRALELAPERAEIYSRFAGWLMRTGGFLSLMHDGICPEELCSVVQRGLEKFPDDPELVRIDEDIRTLQAEAAPYATQASQDRTATAQASAPKATRQATRAAPTLKATAKPSATAVQTEAPPASTRTKPAVVAPVSTTPAVESTGRAGGVCPASLLPLGSMVALLLIVLLRRRT
jgi:hypothetical protein